MGYKFKLEPYDHQMEVLLKSWNKTDWAYFLDMGTGKTKVLLDNAGILYEKDRIDGLLVIAPKGVYRNWNEVEIPKHLPERHNARVAYWRAQANKKELASIASIMAASGQNLDILVMNIDAVNTAKGFACAEEFLANHTAMMAIDESTTIKNDKAKRTKACYKLGKMAAYRRIMTGSPITKSPLDLYGQCAFLDPKLLGHKSFFTFRNEFAVMRELDRGEQVRMVRGKLVKKRLKVPIVVGYRNQDRLHSKLQHFSSRVLKEDCLDLPPKVYMTRKIELTKEQKKAYKELKETCITELDAGEVSTTHVLTKMLRLQQIICGHVTKDDGEIIDLPSKRIQAVKEICAETGGKVLIWARFQRDIEAIRDALVEEYGEAAVATFYGPTKDQERVDIDRNFQNPNHGLRFVVGTQAAGGVGRTLTQGTTVIYYSNSFDLEHRVQSEDRSHRSGQDSKVTYWDLEAEGTIDGHIIKALKSKFDIAKGILGDDLRTWLQ